MNDYLQAVHGQIVRRYVGRPDGTHAELIAALLVDPDGNPVANPADREVLPTRYTVKQAYTGAAVGDVVLKTVVLDVGGGTVDVVGVSWENESSGVVIAAPPSVPVHLEPIKQGDSLTLAQLLSAGLATATNQVTQIGYAADMSADLNTLARKLVYNLVQSEDLGAGTKYILRNWTNRKTGATGWQVIRKTYTDTSSVMGYASQTNNPTVTTASAAWTARASLVYGELSAA